MSKRERLRELREWATKRYFASRKRVQPRAVILEYRCNGQSYKERLPVLPGETADGVARKKMNEYSAVHEFTVTEVF